MISRIFSIILISGILFLFIISSCKKDDSFDTNPALKLEFSSDTIIFDTVFTTIGSITEQIRVYNRNDQKISISSIKLAGSGNSRYSLNVDGEPGTSFSDIEVGGNDSIYIFARVNIDPNDETLPYIVTDSIVFETNGNQQDVDLVAWGQNARFILWDTDRNLWLRRG